MIFYIELTLIREITDPRPAKPFGRARLNSRAGSLRYVRNDVMFWGFETTSHILHSSLSFKSCKTNILNQLIPLRGLTFFTRTIKGNY